MKSTYLKNKLALVLGVVLFCPAMARSQDSSSGANDSAPEAADQGAQVESLSNVLPSELSETIDLDQAATAVRESDEETLLELAEKLGSSERGFPNPVQQKAIQAQIAFLKGSINACRIKRDGKSLDAIAKSIDASKSLPPNVKGELKGLINTTKAAIAAGRKLNPGPGLKVGEASPEAVAIYNAFVDEIAVTEEYGSQEDVAALEFAVKQLKELHAKQRAHLLKLLKDTTTAIADRGDADPTLSLLAFSSRSLSSGLKIVGPSLVRAGSKVQLIIISTSLAPSASKEKLTLTAQILNAKLTGNSSGKFEFTGKPIALQMEIGKVPGPTDRPLNSICSVSLYTNKKTPICKWASKIQMPDPKK